MQQCNIKTSLSEGPKIYHTKDPSSSVISELVESEKIILTPDYIQ